MMKYAPERTRKGLMEKLRVRVDFVVMEHDGKRVKNFTTEQPAGD